MATKTISKEWRNQIKIFEGFRADVYKDSAGCYTVGWGHNLGKTIPKKTTYTKDECEVFFAKDINTAENKVLLFGDKYNFTQAQFDALVSFCFNVGSIKQLTQDGTRTIKAIGDAIVLYNKAGGKKNDGLVIRRKKEQERFFYDTKQDIVYNVTHINSMLHMVKASYRLRKEPNGDTVCILSKNEYAEIIGKCVVEGSTWVKCNFPALNIYDVFVHANAFFILFDVR